MTEILFAVGAGPEVAGVCEPVSYPPQAKTLPVVASWDRLDVERVVALAPQACFTVEGMQAPYALSALRRLGLEVDVYPMRSLHDLWACMDAVAARTGHAAEGARVTAGLQERVAKAGKGLAGPPRRALVVVGLDPLVVAGPGSFLSDVLKASGYVNALSGAGEAYPLLSLEAAAEAEPQTVVFPKGELPPAACERLTTMLGHMEGRAVASVFVPADLLVRPGPRTAQAVEILAAARRRTDQGAGSRERGAGDLARPVVPDAPHLLISASLHHEGPGDDSGIRNSESAMHHQGTKAPRGRWELGLSRVPRLASRVSRPASRVSRLASRVSRPASRVSHLASRVSRPVPRVWLAEPCTGYQPPVHEAAP